MSNETDIRVFRGNLRILEREVEKGLNGATICCGVSVAQCHTLLELGQREKSSIKELADSLEQDKSTLSRVIDGLVNIGLVNREINPEDRRYMNVSLTENGKKTVHTINEYSDKFYDEMFTLIPKDKHHSVIESIQLVGNALKSLDKKHC